MGETLGRLTPIITTLVLVAGSLAVAAIPGTSRTRLRRAIHEELDLVEQLPEGHALRRQLREHTNARITGYLTPPKRTRVASFFAKPSHRRLAFTVVLVDAGLAVSGAVLKGDRSASSVVVALMLVLSSAAALGEVTARNRREAAQRLSGRTL